MLLTMLPRCRHAMLSPCYADYDDAMLILMLSPLLITLFDITPIMRFRQMPR